MAEEFKRAPNHFRGRALADGSSAVAGGAGAVSAGRQPRVPVGQPRDHRAAAARARGGDLAGPWSTRSRTSAAGASTLDPGGRDPVLRLRFLARGLPQAAEPGYDGGRQRASPGRRAQRQAGLPTTTRRLTLDMSTEWTALPPRRRRRSCTHEKLRDEIDDESTRWSSATSTTASTRSASPATSPTYDRRGYNPALRPPRRAVTNAWKASRYLVGDSITEADIRLFVTLVRFDAVYHGHFKCNLLKLTEMPVLWGYTRDLFQTPGLGTPLDFDHIKRHYYVVHDNINPSGIVPAGRNCPARRHRTAAKRWAGARSVTAHRLPERG